jgi:hypothetical protein
MSFNQLLLPLPKPWSNINCNLIIANYTNAINSIYCQNQYLVVRGLLNITSSPAVITPQLLLTSVFYSNLGTPLSVEIPNGSDIVNYITNNYGFTPVVGVTFNVKYTNIGTGLVSLSAATGITYISANGGFILNGQTAYMTWNYLGNNNWQVIF